MNPVLLLLACFVASVAGSGVSEAQRSMDPFTPRNLTAWCIVPFDAKNRNPEERAEMLAKFGLRQFAYDWRDEHLPQLDREIDALAKHRIRLTAFWFPASLEPEKDANARRILDVLKRRKVRTQLWVSLGIPEQSTTHEQRIEIAVKPLRWLSLEAEKIECKVALYNHGGWFGEPENQIAIIKALDRKNVGIVYNFHHGHHQMDRFKGMFTLMKPHLLALNINGMRRDGPKILNIGEGDREEEMLRIVRDSGWIGPIGILGHRAELDAYVALRDNLRGLTGIVSGWRREPAGRLTPRTFD